MIFTVGKIISFLAKINLTVKLYRYYKNQANTLRVSLVHKLDMEGICEGVETEEQNTLVTESDCDYIQGWYYAKAMPIEECESFIEGYNMC